MKIANVMKKTESYTVRILEELTNHYFLAEDFFQLKQTIATIDTFLLLFNPYTKYDLCRYWQILEGAGYDPVVEYNKGLELFDMHFSPKPEDLFTIILQISRFLKEFSDFETKNTPKFRHPYIKGKIVKEKPKASEEFSLFENKKEGEEGKKDMPKSKKEKQSDKNSMKYDVMKFLEVHSKETKDLLESEKKKTHTTKDLPFDEDDEIMDELELKKEQEKKIKGMISYLDDIGLEREISYMRITEELYGDFLKGHENYGVDVPSGKVSFSFG